MLEQYLEAVKSSEFPNAEFDREISLQTRTKTLTVGGNEIDKYRVSIGDRRNSKHGEKDGHTITHYVVSGLKRFGPYSVDYFKDVCRKCSYEKRGVVVFDNIENECYVHEYSTWFGDVKDLEKKLVF